MAVKALVTMKIRRVNLLPRTAMTPMERRAGRFMRAPDHDAGTGSGDAAPAPAADAAAVTAEAAAAADTVAPGDDSTLLGADPANAEGGDQKSGDEGKQSDAAAALIGAPEKYEFTLPEGVALDEEAFAAVEPVLREMDLSQEAAGKIVGAYAEKVLPLLQARADQQSSAAGEELRADWAKATMADNEVGGPKLEESKAMAARTMAKFLPQHEEGQRFRTFLNESGLGNHPEMMRMLSRIGRQLSEGTVDQGTTVTTQKTTAEKFFGPNYAN